MTLSWPWGNTPLKPNPNSCHHVYLGWDSSSVFDVVAIGPNMTIVELIIWSISAIWERGGIRKTWWGITPPGITPLGCFGYIPMLGSSWFLTTIDISSELNWSKTNKNRLFSHILSWFDLPVTLRWPCHDLGVTPQWSPTPTHVTIGIHQTYLKC